MLSSNSGRCVAPSCIFKAGSVTWLWPFFLGYISPCDFSASLLMWDRDNPKQFPYFKFCLISNFKSICNINFPFVQQPNIFLDLWDEDGELFDGHSSLFPSHHSLEWSYEWQDLPTTFIAVMFLIQIHTEPFTFPPVINPYWGTVQTFQA